MSPQVAPSDEELVAITAAVEAAWPPAVVVAADGDPTPAWRFSGRSWARPAAARRQRPFRH